jgi:hypothetical protein
LEERKNISHYRIFDYWKDKAITEDGDIVDANDEKYFSTSIEVIRDYGEPECFACKKLVDAVLESPKYEKMLVEDDGLKKIWEHKEVSKKLQKCHIIPHSLGGDENPKNMFLLCKDCHEESPDTNNPKNFFKWVYRKRNSPSHLRKRYMMFVEECIERDVNSSTANEDEWLKNSAPHAARFSDYTYVMGMADTCRKFPEGMVGNALRELQIDIYETMKKQFAYNI